MLKVRLSKREKEVVAKMTASENERARIYKAADKWWLGNSDDEEPIDKDTIQSLLEKGFIEVTEYAIKEAE